MPHSARRKDPTYPKGMKARQPDSQPPILQNIQSGISLQNYVKGKQPLMEDDLKILKSQQPMIRSSLNFKIKLMGPNNKCKLHEMKTDGRQPQIGSY